ncbi:hypothetical protein [Natronorubrum halophilum]|uniref:hypothetical protein n=1 Tax=Natronorubrum halophilum TaxID=1702106 RepID=UPI000EF711BE|nr:hypothetical protein [Natronorubrum halophilum]
MSEYSVLNVHHYHHYDDGELWLDPEYRNLGIGKNKNSGTEDVDIYEYVDQELGIGRNSYKGPYYKGLNIGFKEWQKYHQVLVIATVGAAAVDESEMETDFFVEFSDGKYAIFEDVKPIVYSPPHHGAPL